MATLSLFGYDPLAVYTGRAPLETAAMGIPLGPDDWAIRCNLVTVDDGLMRDFTAGHITSEDGERLIGRDPRAARRPRAAGGRLEFHAGVSYRNILVYRGRRRPPRSRPRRRRSRRTTSPTGPSPTTCRPGRAADLLLDLMERSQAVLADHPVNRERSAAASKPATQVWLWGQGKAPSLRPFAEVYGKKGAIYRAVDLVRGVGVLLGWTRIDVPGATGYLDTDYAAKGRSGVAALADHDLVCVHVEAPDEASHEGRADEKVKALERIDEHIVGPLLDALPRYGDWRILVSPDHRTPLRTRAHAYGAVPFALAGTGVIPPRAGVLRRGRGRPGALAFDPGWQLMRWFLG